MNFADTADEAEFRRRIRAWLVDQGDEIKRSHTDDDYWASLAGWHHQLYDAGFFGLAFPARYGGRELSPVYEVIVDEELARAGAPPKPSLGYLVQGILEHGNDAVKERFLPGLINGRDRWCQGFSEPDAGSDLASLRTTAVRDGDQFIVNGHKIWTSYSDTAEWCLLLARTDPDVAKHRGLSAFAVRMDHPGVEQRPLQMINGISNEFGQVILDDVEVPADAMIGEPGSGWRLAMTIVSHEREPAELGFASRYLKAVRDLEALAAARADITPDQQRELSWAFVEAEMLRVHTARRLSQRLDGITHGPEGSIDKLLMTWAEQSVGHACLSLGLADAAGGRGGHDQLDFYLYSRAQSVMGGTAQIQKNIIATRILDLPPS